MAELRPIAHRRVDVEHGHFAYEHVTAQGHRPDLDSTGLCPVAVEARLSADHCSCADCEQVRAHRYLPGEDHGTGPHLRAQRPQVEPIQRRSDEQIDARVRPDQGLHDPEADVRKAPQTDLLGLPTTDEQPLRYDRYGAHDEEPHTAENDQPQIAFDTLRSCHHPLVALDAGKDADVRVS